MSAHLIVDGVETRSRQATIPPEASLILRLRVHEAPRADLSIWTNDPVQARRQVRIRAEVHPFYTWSSPSLAREHVPYGEEFTRTLTLASPPGESFEILEFLGDPAFLATWRAVPPRTGTGHCYAVEVTVCANPDQGHAPVPAQLAFRTSHPRFPLATLPVLADFEPEVEVTYRSKTVRDTLSLGLLRPGETRTLEVVNHNPDVPYVLQDVRIEGRQSASALSVSLETREWGQHYTISLSTVDGLRVGVRGTLQLVALHPRAAEIRIDVNGLLGPQKAGH